MKLSRNGILIVVGFVFTALYCFSMIRILTENPEKGAADDRSALENALYSFYSQEYMKNTSRIALPGRRQNKQPVLEVCREFFSSLLEKRNDRFFTSLVGLPYSIEMSPDIALMKRIVDTVSQCDFDSSFLFPEKLVFPINLLPAYVGFLSCSDTSFFYDGALFDAIKRTAIIYHDRDYIIAADTLFKLLETRFHFNDPEIRAWHGSVTTKFALFASSPVDQVDFVAKGVAMIDGSVNKAPKNLNIRFIRYFNFLKLPSFFKKRMIIMNDIRFLQKEFMENGRLEVVDRGKAQDVMLGEKDIIAALDTGIASPNLTADDKSELCRLLAQVKSGVK